MLTYEKIVSVEKFIELRGEWNSLLNKSDNTVPYLRHEWLESWWYGFGQGHRLHVILVRDNGQLIGAAPLMVSRRTLSKLPVVAVHFIGLNFGFLDFIAVERKRECLSLFMKLLLEESDSDVIIIKGISAQSDHDQILRDLLTQRQIKFNVKTHGEIFIDTRSGKQRYIEERSTKLWSNIRNRRKRLERLGKVEFIRYQKNDDPSEIMNEAFDVSLRSWKGKTGTAISLKEEFRRFFTRQFDLFSQNGGAEIWIMRSNGKGIACRLGFVDRGIYVESEIAYDEAFAPYSPGTILSAVSNEVLIQEGISEINLGMAFAWKQEWSPQSKERLEFFIFNPAGIYPRLLYKLQDWNGRYVQRFAHGTAPLNEGDG